MTNTFHIPAVSYRVSKKTETIEASLVGIPAGYFPDRITVHTDATGRSLEYAKKSVMTDREGDVLLVDYIEKQYGFKLTVLND